MCADCTLPLERNTRRLYNLQQLQWVTAGICSTKGLQGGEHACLIPSRCRAGSGAGGSSPSCVSLPPAPGPSPHSCASLEWDGGFPTGLLVPRSGGVPVVACSTQAWDVVPGYGMWYPNMGHSTLTRNVVP